jgi:hypothetical protein
LFHEEDFGNSIIDGTLHYIAASAGMKLEPDFRVL